VKLPPTDLLPRLWRRLACVFKDHNPAAAIKWSPEVICMHLFCTRCGKEIGHMDLPASMGSKKESLH
jgi:hypothetical protein